MNDEKDRGEPALEWQDFKPFRVVSLLDMLRFYSERFISLTNLFSSSLGGFDVVLQHKVNHEPFGPGRCGLIKDFEEMSGLCKELGLVYSERQVNRMRNWAMSKETTLEFLTAQFRDLNTRIYDDLSLSVCFIISNPAAKEYYDTPHLFGDSVFDSFPSANFDIEEAGKCFAVGRYTACVMHLQRVLEISLKAYGTFLGIASLLGTEAQPNWNTILNQTRKVMKDRNDKAVLTENWASKEEKAFCEDVQPFLEAIKIAWRNPSMHADKVYNEEIAEDIFSAVKRFVKHLGQHVDEAGKFTP